MKGIKLTKGDSITVRLMDGFKNVATFVAIHGYVFLFILIKSIYYNITFDPFISRG